MTDDTLDKLGAALRIEQIGEDLEAIQDQQRQIIAELLSSVQNYIDICTKDLND